MGVVVLSCMSEKEGERGFVFERERERERERETQGWMEGQRACKVSETLKNKGG